MESFNSTLMHPAINSPASERMKANSTSSKLDSEVLPFELHVLEFGLGEVSDSSRGTVTVRLACFSCKHRFAASVCYSTGLFSALNVVQALLGLKRITDVWERNSI